MRSITKLRKLVASRRLAEARNLCLDLTRTYPQDIEVWTMRGGMHFQLGELDSVVECSRRIIALDSRNADAYFNLGLALHGLKRLPETEAAYRAALRIHPGYTNALAQLAGILMEQKRPAEAWSLLEGAIAGAPQYAFLHYNLGLVFLGLGQRDDALRSFERAVDLNPSLAEGHYQLGLMPYHKDEYDAAISRLSRATSLNPALVEAYRTLGAAYIKTGR